VELRTAALMGGEDSEDDVDRERGGTAHHAAAGVSWLSTAAIFRQPSILRNLICPLTTRLNRRTRAASSPGSDALGLHPPTKLFVQPLNVFVVRRLFHCGFGNVKHVSTRVVGSRSTRADHTRWVENPMDVATPRFCLVAWIAWKPITVGYEPFSNRDWSQSATNNAS
jgi:hypothetical protein